MARRPTIEEPRYVTTVYGGAGWVFEDDDGELLIEHHVDGRGWVACPLTLSDRNRPDRAIGQATIRHLARRPHVGTRPLRLLRSHHAGGRRQHDGRWIQLDREVD